jgi:hypothetical protein
VAAALLASTAGRTQAASPRAAGGSAVSPNWSGYVVTAKPGTRYSSVTGTWRQPAVSCTRDAKEFSTIAVGLGGYGSNPQSDEQVGADANCGPSGKPAYYGWFDVAPYPSYSIPHKVSPGDLLTATVSIVSVVHPALVRVQLDNSTAGWSFTREISWVSAGTTVQQPGTQNAGGRDSPAASSAEWLVEAPSSCRYEACAQTSLANFGSVAITNASAVVDGVPGTLADPRWDVVRLRLVPGRVRVPSYPRSTPFSRSPLTDGIAGSPAGATPGHLSANGRSFKVKWLPVAAKNDL